MVKNGKQSKKLHIFVECSYILYKILRNLWIELLQYPKLKFFKIMILGYLFDFWIVEFLLFIRTILCIMTDCF